MHMRRTFKMARVQLLQMSTPRNIGPGKGWWLWGVLSWRGFQRSPCSFEFDTWISKHIVDGYVP